MSDKTVKRLFFPSFPMRKQADPPELPELTVPKEAIAPKEAESLSSRRTKRTNKQQSPATKRGVFLRTVL